MKRTYAFFHRGRHLNLDKGSGESNTRYSMRLNFIIERQDLYDFELLEEYSHIYSDMMLHGCKYPQSVTLLLGKMMAKQPINTDVDSQEDLVNEISQVLSEEIVKSFDGQSVVFENGTIIATASVSDSYMVAEPSIDISGAVVQNISLQHSSETGDNVGLVINVQTEYEDVTIKSCDRQMCLEPSDIIVVTPENIGITEIVKAQSPSLEGVEMFGDPDARNFFLAMEHIFDATSIMTIFVSILTGKQIKNPEPSELRQIFDSTGPFTDEKEDEAMEEAIATKFSVGNFSSKLKATKKKNLVYNNSAEDYWGIRWGNSLKGDNNYGKLLMRYREKLQEELEYGLSPVPEVRIETSPIPLEETIIAEEKPSEETIIPEEKPSEETIIPEEKPSEETIIAEEKPSEETIIPEEKPSEETIIPEEKPSEETIIPEEKPSEETIIAEEKPSEVRIETTPIPLEEHLPVESASLNTFCDDEVGSIDRSLIISKFDDRLMRGTLIRYDDCVLMDLFRAYDVGLFGGKLGQKLKNDSLKVQISWDDGGVQESPGVSDVSRNNSTLLCTLVLSKCVFGKLSGNRKGNHKIFGVECSTQFEVIMTFLESFFTMTGLEVCGKDSNDSEIYSKYAGKFFHHVGSDCVFSPPDDDLRQRLLNLKKVPTNVVKVTLKDGKEYEVAGARSTSEVMLKDGEESKRVAYSEITHVNGESL
jgi:hypothetical protein